MPVLSLPSFARGSSATACCSPSSSVSGGVHCSCARMCDRVNFERAKQFCDVVAAPENSATDPHHRFGNGNEPGYARRGIFQSRV